MVSYNNDIPDTANNPSADQPLLKENTNAIDTIIGIDHISFNSPDGGTHQQVHLSDQSAPGLLGVDSVLYSNASAGNSWPFWQNSLVSALQLAGPVATVSAALQGVTTLPGGIILQWGQGTTNGSGNATITFAPAFTTFYSAILTRIETGGNNRGFVQFSALPTSVSGLVVMRDSGGSGIAGSFLWVAIGA